MVPGGAWSWGGGLVETPPEPATAAGGTHPTGMHSCYLMCEKKTTLGLIKRLM